MMCAGTRLAHAQPASQPASRERRPYLFTFHARSQGNASVGWFAYRRIAISTFSVTPGSSRKFTYGASIGKLRLLAFTVSK